MKKLVEVAAFVNEIDMSFVRNKMEDKGIPTELKDEHVNSMREFSSGSLNGIKIMVFEEDYERAMAYLVEIGHYKEEDFKPTWLEEKLQNIFGKK